MLTGEWVPKEVQDLGRHRVDICGSFCGGDPQQ